MINRLASTARRLGRRSFLRGAAGVSVALPFLESLPERSAWAADEDPVFALFICGVGGVIPSRFFPDEPGPLVPAQLASAGKATSELAAHAENLLFVSGIDWPGPSSSTMHVEGLCMALTGRLTQRGLPERPSCGSEDCIVASGPSADFVICEKTQPGSLPLVITNRNHNSGYVTDRLSFSAAGLPASAIYNPYELYQQLVGLAAPDGSMPLDAERAAKLLLESRASVHDLVREELRALLKHPRLSSADRQRLELHFDSIRDVEVTMGGMGNEAVERCTSQGLDVGKLEALKDFKYDAHRTEEIGQLQLSLLALAFACNYTRAASLQWGDAYDRAIYDVPSNDRGWSFGHISHQAESDSAVGDDPLAAQAHAEIDAVRMRSLAAGINHFEARGLRDHSFVMWTNHYGESRSHAPTDVPHIIWGNAGGYLKQGAFVDAGGTTNNRLLNTLISAAIQDTGETVEDFGEGLPGQLDLIRA